MTHDLLLTDWAAIAAADPAQTGGKAGNLARLVRYGLPVPPGLCLPTAVHDAWLQGSGLRPELLQLCDAGDAATPAQWQALRARLAQVPVPQPLRAAWQEAVRGPAAWAAGAPLAVRSSSPQEDSAQASFAGIHHSALNVQAHEGRMPRGAAEDPRGSVDSNDRPGEDEPSGPRGQGDDSFWQAVVAVWCSLWTPAAAAYRTRMGLAHDQARMAVLVMPLIPAQASGIGFTHEPATGRPDRLLIHANWGLGESLVGGHARGDEIVLASSPLDHRVQWLSQRIGEKQQRSVQQDGGGTRLDTPDAAQRAQPVLTREQAVQLGGLLQRAALSLDWERPAFDFEWAWDGTRFWILQARPITAMARHTYAALRDQPEILSRGNVREISPFPLQPIDWSATQAVAFPISDAAARAGGFPMPPALPRLALRQGYLYLNMSLMQWESWAAYAMEPADFNRMIGGHHGEVRVPAATWRDQLRRAACFARYLAYTPGLRRLGRRQTDEVLRYSRAQAQMALPGNDAGMARLWRERTDWYGRMQGVIFLQGSAGASMWMLVQLIERYLPGEGHALASAMLAGGEPSVTAQQSLDLADVARVVQADPLARAWLECFDRVNAEAPAAGAGGASDTSDWESLPADNPFRQAFAAFLDRYGHRATYETYTRHPRWRETPDYLLRQLTGLMALDLRAVRDAAPAQQAMVRARRALPWWQALRLKPLVNMARQEFSDRERARSAVMSAIEPARALLLTLGQRWVARGWLTRADDSFFLTAPELLGALDGERDGAGLRALADDRRVRFDLQCRRDDVPDVLLEGAPGMAAPAGADEPVVASASEAVFHGVCVGRGQAAGAACTMQSPQEGAKLRPGDILVVPSTDPSWTPLFLKVGGLVMETGGFLSHGAIVAREFGIPAVVNVPGIMRRVRDGQQLQVDAASATVRMLA